MLYNNDRIEESKNEAWFAVLDFNVIFNQSKYVYFPFKDTLKRLLTAACPRYPSIPEMTRYLGFIKQMPTDPSDIP